jgi:hypothetical protein
VCSLGHSRPFVLHNLFAARLCCLVGLAAIFFGPVASPPRVRSNAMADMGGDAATGSAAKLTAD